ncbi:MAG TPA: sulfite exporter TauE/SafE family protein [Chloroflexota bacterium]|nr:sulfite exporter TauE/SafE family protein [Chloroflexota bacterium]
MTIDPQTALVGAVVGLLVGWTGMGGASLMTPLMILVLGVRPVIAVGTDLVYSTITKVFGAGMHMRYGTVDRGVALRLAAGSLPGGLLGVLGLSLLKRRLPIDSLDAIVLKLVGCLLIVVAATMVIRAISPHLFKRAAEASEPRLKGLLPVVGFVVGFLVGLTSVGSGTLIVAALGLLTALPARKVVGTDLFHGLLLVAVTGIAQLFIGTVDLHLAANLLVGSIPGVLIGSRLSVTLPERPLRLALATVLLISGAKLF